MKTYFITVLFIFLFYYVCATGTVELKKGKGKPKKSAIRENENQVTEPDNKSTQFVSGDLQKFGSETKKFQSNRPVNDSMELFNAYNLKQQLETIISDFPEVNVTAQVLGKTMEYNDIVLLKVTHIESSEKHQNNFRADKNKFTDEKPEKKIIFIVHGLSSMGVQFLSCFRRFRHFKLLLSYYFEHLDKFDIFLMPMANPDGFAYVMNQPARHWNKNMSPQMACRGIALDRNFDVAWNTTKVVNPCSHQYPGTTPFSEEETKAVREVFQRYGHKIIAYIHVHSGTFDTDTFKGDAVLYPRGFSEITTDDDKYIDLRGEIDEAIRDNNFEFVSVYVDTLYSWYGKIFGSSVDYAATIYGIPYAMEFVMQLYEAEPPDSQSTEAAVVEDALTEVWHRVINVTFVNIWKSLNVVEF